MAVKILSKNLAKGVDFCGVDDYYYIVRADLNCYMRSSDLQAGRDLIIYSLHPSCANGDHYLADKNGYFYIIKGDSYRRVTNMSEDLDAIVSTLHPNCQGGDHYLSSGDNYYVIFEKRGICRKNKNIHTDEGGQDFILHPDCRNALYYFGIEDYNCFVKPDEEWGLEYTRTTDLQSDEYNETFSIHTDVINFLPGGLGITKGPSYGKWVCIKTIKNTSNIPIMCLEKVTKKVGYEKEMISSVDENWNTDPKASIEASGLTCLVAQSQMALPMEYGGSSVNTATENWNQATETKEMINVALKPKENVFIWEYQLGLGIEPMLYCRDIRITDSPDPPSDVPLPPASN